MTGSVSHSFNTAMFRCLTLTILDATNVIAIIRVVEASYRCFMLIVYYYVVLCISLRHSVGFDLFILILLFSVLCVSLRPSFNAFHLLLQFVVPFTILERTHVHHVPMLYYS